MKSLVFFHVYVDYYYYIYIQSTREKTQKAGKVWVFSNSLLNFSCPNLYISSQMYNL